MARRSHLLLGVFLTVALLVMLAHSMGALVGRARQLEHEAKAASPAPPRSVPRAEEDRFWARARTHAAGPDAEPLRAYRVDRLASACADRGTAPEAACAARLRAAGTDHTPPQAACLQSRVREVWLFHHHFAGLLVTSPSEGGEVRPHLQLLEVVDGRWQRTGGKEVAGAEEARLYLARGFLTLRPRPPLLHAGAIHRGRWLMHAMEQPQALQTQAQRVFRQLRAMDAEALSRAPEGDLGRHLLADYPPANSRAWAVWARTTFRHRPIVRVELGETFLTSRPPRFPEQPWSAVPAVPYRLTLQDGSHLSGRLLFRADPKEAGPAPRWQAISGLGPRPPRG